MKRVKPLKWLKQDANGYWHTTDGKYAVWLQARPYDSGSGSEYAASTDNGKHWLCRYASTSREAKRECAEHAAGIPKEDHDT